MTDEQLAEERDRRYVERFEALEKLAEERDRRYEDRFTAMDEKTGLALNSSKEAVIKAEAATEKRFDSVNEFRGSLKDQAATLLPRIEAETRFKALEDKLEEVKNNRQATARYSLDKVISIVSLLIAAIAVFSRFIR